MRLSFVKISFSSFSIFVFLLMTLWACDEKFLPVEKEDIVIFCDVEKSDGDDLLAGKYRLSGAKNKSNLKARSGEHSLVIDTLNPYGFNYKVKDVKKGEAYVCSVWRSLEDAEATLVLAGGNKDDKLYHQMNFVSRDEDEWGLIRMHWVADKDYDSISFYCYNPSGRKAFLDDFELKAFRNCILPEPDKNALRIVFDKNVEKQLEESRIKAIEQGIITDDLKQEYEGSLVVNGDEIPVKLRFKGDWTDHLETDKWSFRIKVRGDRAYMGLKSFSVQNPNTRAFMMEWLAHRLFEEEDVLTTKYTFVTVIVNGENKGVYALEEHFDKQLLERNNRREGPIVKYDESGVWNMHYNEVNSGQFLSMPVLESAEILPFKKNRTYKSEVLRGNFILAMSHMDRLRNRDENVSAYCDANALAKFLALQDVLNARHSMIWHNIRMYMNPITQRLEPIAFDCFADLDEVNYKVDPIGAQWLRNDRYSILNSTLNDPEVNELYTKYLGKYSSEAFLNAFFAKIEKEMEEFSKLLSYETPNYSFDKTYFYLLAKQNREFLSDFSETAKDGYSLRYECEPEFADLPEGLLFESIALKANRVSLNPTHTTVRLSNFHTSPIEVYAYTVKSLLTESDSLIRMSRPILLDEYRTKADFEELSLKGNIRSFSYKAANCPGKVFREKVNRWPPVKRMPDMEISSRNLRLKEKDGILTLAVGSYTINRDVVIPKGKIVRIPQGSSINLVNGAAFISYSPVIIGDKSGSPVMIRSSDSSGCVVVIGNGEESKLSNVIFSKLNTVSRDYWNLTGAVNFYQSKVEMDNCHFSNNHCEDALNLIRCEFEISNCHFDNAFSDGFDGDFCTGMISNSEFRKSGNDCMDFSGSVVTIKACTIAEAGDKGISGGEASRLKIIDVTVNKASIAIASKDDSDVFVKNIRVINANYAFAAFMKKEEYGPSVMTVESMSLNRAKNKFILDLGSTIKFEQNKYRGSSRVNIDSLYYAYHK